MQTKKNIDGYIIIGIYTVGLSFISGLILGAIFFSKETSIYAQPSIVTEQAKVLESCMAGYDRTLKLLKESNDLLDKMTQ